MLLTTRLSCQTSGYVIENGVKTRWDIFAVAVQLATANRPLEFVSAVDVRRDTFGRQ